jgi:hypothetical protein
LRREAADSDVCGVYLLPQCHEVSCSLSLHTEMMRRIVKAIAVEELPMAHLERVFAVKKEVGEASIAAMNAVNASAHQSFRSLLGIGTVVGGVTVGLNQCFDDWRAKDIQKATEQKMDDMEKKMDDMGEKMDDLAGKVDGLVALIAKPDGQPKAAT